MGALDTQLFAKDAGLNVSAKYVAINTANIIQAFQFAGFELHRGSRNRVNNKAKEGFQKHLLAFRHPDIQLKSVGDVVPEILLKNSYDGSCAYVLTLGVYRLACANGLVVGTTFESVRTIHIGKNALQKAIDGAFQIAGQVEALSAKIKAMQSVSMSPAMQLEFAQRAMKLILPETAVTADASSLLTARREADTANDLWTVFNRVQEAVIRGGGRYQSVNASGVVRNNTSRAVRSIDRNIGLNKELWTLAETFIKAA